MIIKPTKNAFISKLRVLLNKAYKENEDTEMLEYMLEFFQCMTDGEFIPVRDRFLSEMFKTDESLVE